MGSSETPSMATQSMRYQDNSKQSVEETSEVSTASPKTAIIIKENSATTNVAVDENGRLREEYEQLKMQLDQIKS